jgi:hypothetical protein
MDAIEPMNLERVIPREGGCRERRADLQQHFTSYQPSAELDDVVEDVHICRNSTQPHSATIGYNRGMDAIEPMNLERVIPREGGCRERQADLQRHFPSRKPSVKLDAVVEDVQISRKSTQPHSAIIF